MNFLNPWFLILLPPVFVFIFYARRIGSPSVRFSSGRFFSPLGTSFKIRLNKNIIFLRGGAAFLIIFALARPQSPVEESRIQTEGVDIVLAVDVSTSMLAEDFKIRGKRVNRLEAVKDVVENFIKGRKNDRIGMVVFAAMAYTVCPITIDYGWLLQNLERVKIGMVEDGTAIGLGILSSLNRLKDSEAKGKVIILLTDGRNNAGDISPLTAAEAARALGVKIYTIGAGTRGTAPYPAKDFFGNTVYKPVKVDIDEDTLMKIASETGAKYFRATDTGSLEKIYDEINKLEKTPMEEKGYLEYSKLFPVFLIPGIFLLFLEIVLSNTILRKVP